MAEYYNVICDLVKTINILNSTRKTNIVHKKTFLQQQTTLLPTRTKVNNNVNKDTKVKTWWWHRIKVLQKEKELLGV